MINDTTVIRFHFESLEATVIKPSVLADMVAAIEAFALRSTAGFGAKTIELVLVASPRRGSIEFHVLPRFRFADSTLKKVLGRLYPHKKIGAVDVAVVAAALWSVLFAPGGFFEGSLPGQKPVPSAFGADDRALLKEIVREHSNAIFSIDSILRSAKASGATRVEIQLRDTKAVVVFQKEPETSDERRHRLDIQKVVENLDDMGIPEIIRPMNIDFRPLNRSSMPAEFEGRKYRAFYATRLLKDPQTGAMSGGPVMLLLWPAERNLPKVEEDHAWRFVVIPAREQISIPNHYSAELQSDIPIAVACTDKNARDFLTSLHRQQAGD